MGAPTEAVLKLILCALAVGVLARRPVAGAGCGGSRACLHQLRSLPRLASAARPRAVPLLPGLPLLPRAEARRPLRRLAGRAVPEPSGARRAARDARPSLP